MRIGSILIAAMLPLVQAVQIQAAPVETVSGTWQIAPARASQTEQLTLQSVSADSHDRDTTSFPLGAADLRITAGLAATNPTNISFSIVRDAGGVAATGSASHGVGNGTFVFTPSDAYRSRMHDRGYGDLNQRQTYSAFAIDLSNDFIDGVVAAGYPHLSFEELIAFRALGIDRAFIADMHATFPKMVIDADEMTALRALDVSGSYVTKMRGEGFNVGEPHDAVQLRALNVNREFLRDLAAAGYSGISADDLVQLRALGIDGAYIERVRAHGFKHLPIDKLIQLKTLGVISMESK